MPGRLKFAVAMIAVVYAHPLHAQSLQEAQARSPEARARMVARLLDLKTGPMAKVGPTLALLHEEYEAYLQQGTRGPFRPGDPTARVIGDRVVIDAVAATTAAALLADLQALDLGNGATAGRMVSGTAPHLGAGRAGGTRHAPVRAAGRLQDSRADGRRGRGV